ncbi:uncharacterized protein M421DRAFT_91113 [Didymella exigua CBS 183.55]|uniref:Uncharacterized protein n=1 Tax=Didymella exigua CBS 183.55 TaxID=1150837 RepID=A0A6A5RQK9_9PLEO|nr:uncharacterized protein M421DRAFT_91113 [Didymella exigua CBS 183.55]KAF1930625.1 hypothetical protein M421DRAFT_91113 [Didymella exigua CBS 183.55]
MSCWSQVFTVPSLSLGISTLPINLSRHLEELGHLRVFSACASPAGPPRIALHPSLSLVSPSQLLLLRCAALPQPHSLDPEVRHRVVVVPSPTSCGPIAETTVEIPVQTALVMLAQRRKTASPVTRLEMDAKFKKSKEYALYNACR